MAKRKKRGRYTPPTRRHGSGWEPLQGREVTVGEYLDQVVETLRRCPADVRLEAVRVLQQMLQGVEMAAARELRSDGRTWGEIAECAALTRQGAMRRYADAVNGGGR